MKVKVKVEGHLHVRGLNISIEDLYGGLFSQGRKGGRRIKRRKPKD